MKPDRAIKLGLVATVGVGFISILTGHLIWTEYTTTIREPSWLLMLIIGLGGLTGIMVFLFLVIGVYIDQELEASGVASSGVEDHSS